MNEVLLMGSIKMNQHRICAGLLGAMLIISSLLSGCASVMHRLGYVPMQQSSREDCATASVLMTNLKERVPHRHYQLLDGQLCSKGVDDEQE